MWTCFDIAINYNLPIYLEAPGQTMSQYGANRSPHDTIIGYRWTAQTNIAGGHDIYLCYL